MIVSSHLMPGPPVEMTDSAVLIETIYGIVLVFYGFIIHFWWPKTNVFVMYLLMN